MTQAVICPNGFPAVRASPMEIARRLASFNRRRFTPGLGGEVKTTSFERDSEEWDLHSQELAFVHDALIAVEEQASEAPTDPDAFMQWFERLEVTGPGQHDPLFEWLETSATKETMTWFLAQEVAGEAGFEDLVALTQVKMPTRAKLELARNYWDEMGQGQASAMHGPMLSRLAEELGIASELEDAVWESLALSNLMIGMAVHRRHAYRSIGALGVIELTAPRRARKVNEGLKRLGLGGEARRYYALHSTLDLKHSEAWNREILRPLVAADPRIARPMAEGAFARLTAGARCYERYRRTLNLARDETPNRSTF
jgi:Iron-containing redox enzyme